MELSQLLGHFFQIIEDVCINILILVNVQILQIFNLDLFLFDVLTAKELLRDICNLLGLLFIINLFRDLVHNLVGVFRKQQLSLDINFLNVHFDNFFLTGVTFGI